MMSVAKRAKNYEYFAPKPLVYIDLRTPLNHYTFIAGKTN